MLTWFLLLLLNILNEPYNLRLQKNRFCDCQNIYDQYFLEGKAHKGYRNCLVFCIQCSSCVEKKKKKRKMAVAMMYLYHCYSFLS